MAVRAGDEFAGSTVLVCGTGVAGRSAIRALSARRSRVLVSGSTGPTNDLGDAEFLGDIAELPLVDFVVTSPGLPPSHPLLSAAVARGVAVWGELELAWRLRGDNAADWLIVTGTNGKTTTVGMLESIVRADGKRCLAVGNVGVPIIDAVTEGSYDVLAVEASSFQLAFSASLRPVAGAVLNLAEDHLDWHGSMASYAKAKAKVWGGRVAVANADDDAVLALLAGNPGTSAPVLFTADEPAPGQFGVAAGMLVDRASVREPAGRALLATAEVRPPGRHNLSNALAAIALARTVEVSDAGIVAGLRAYQPAAHRNAFVTTVDGVDFVDDSKATNPHAAAASLAAYPRVVWIGGGQLKGADVEPLVRRFTPALVGAVVLGQDGGVIKAALARHAPDLPVIGIDRTDDGAMTAVVSAAASLASPGDVVLLAPAAASKDMFTGYDARGAAFVRAVRQLAEGRPA